MIYNYVYLYIYNYIWIYNYIYLYITPRPRRGSLHSFIYSYIKLCGTRVICHIYGHRLCMHRMKACMHFLCAYMYDTLIFMSPYFCAIHSCNLTYIGYIYDTLCHACIIYAAYMEFFHGLISHNSREGAKKETIYSYEDSERITFRS